MTQALKHRCPRCGAETLVKDKLCVDCMELMLPDLSKADVRERLFHIRAVLAPDNIDKYVRLGARGIEAALRQVEHEAKMIRRTMDKQWHDDQELLDATNSSDLKYRMRRQNQD